MSSVVVSIKTEGLDGKLIDAAVSDGLTAYGKTWLQDSNDHTPVRTGELRSSNEMEESNGELTASNSEEYASYVAENVGNWFEDTFSEDEMRRIVDEEIERQFNK